MLGTDSSNIVTAAGAFDSGRSGVTDGVLVKLLPDFQLGALAMIGGDGPDTVDGIGVDARGRVFCSGSTHSTNFPVTLNSTQHTRSGDSDAIAFVFDNDLTGLLYSTYFGGANYDLFRGSYIDAKGILYGAGASVSTDLPTMNAEDSSYGGSNDPRWGNGDAMLVKFTDLNLYLGDADQDLLPDTWEIANFGSTGQDADSDLDLDGNSNRLEFLHSTDPNDRHSFFGACLKDLNTMQISPSSDLVDYEIHWSADLSQPVGMWPRLEIIGMSGSFSLPDVTSFAPSDPRSLFFSVRATPKF